jgi:hypothetical protein
VLRAKMDDTENLQKIYERGYYKMAHDTAKKAAKLWKDGHNLLITCHAGLNRSGLVSGLTLHYITNASGWLCAKRVVQRRQYALINTVFANHLADLPSRYVI